MYFPPLPSGTGGEGWVRGSRHRGHRWLPKGDSLVYDSSMQTELEQLRKLPVAEKLRIVEELWDDIHESDEQLVLRDWHREESERRASQLEANPEIAITRDELWKRVDKTNG